MTGILEIKREVPQTKEQWSKVLRRLNESIKYENGIVIQALRIAERDGITIDEALALIGDDGRAIDQSFLPVVNFGNVSSVQNIDPLGSSAGVTTADISVAAHVLHTDFADIAYGPGSITGLLLNTRYYITASDPNYQGGAVTYVASTSRPNLTSGGVDPSGRYFVGTIVTPESANTASINDATSVNPVKFTTAAAHGWTTGDSVDFATLPGDFGTAFNTGVFVITVIDSDEFTVAIDGSLFAAYTSGGSATRVVADTDPDFGGGGGGYIPYG